MIIRIPFLILAILLGPSVFSQTDSALFNKDFPLVDGIYTSYKQLLKNDPKYKGCFIQKHDDGSLFISCDNEFRQVDSTERAWALVKNGELFMITGRLYNRVILKGAICTFYIEYTNGNSAAGFSNYNDVLFFVDLKTGKSDLLKPKNIVNIFSRDPKLYNEYEGLSRSKQKKLLYSYVMKFNRRNPVYLPLKQR